MKYCGAVGGGVGEGASYQILLEGKVILIAVCSEARVCRPTQLVLFTHN